jgi:hypothetical protein
LRCEAVASRNRLPAGYEAGICGREGKGVKKDAFKLFYEEFSSGPYIREPGTESESGGRSDGESGADGAGKMQFPKPQRKGREQHSRDTI